MHAQSGGIVSVSEASFTKLFQRLAGIDLFGSGPPEVPWQGTVPSADAFRAAIDPAASRLPLAFHAAYIDPLRQNLDQVMQALTGADDILETVGAAIYDHRVDGIDPELDRFLAVISNFYRSFLDATKRASAGFPQISEQLPPLAMFQHDGQNGPFTLTVDTISSLFGGAVGVVSLPSTFRDHPLLWASLAHETGGHDCLHADAGLLPELSQSVRTFFGGGGAVPSSGHIPVSQFLGLLWSYWMDEAASDVYGAMNIGPGFGLNLVAFFAAMWERLKPTGKPTLRTVSGADQSGMLDPHPTDILRPYLVMGAVEALQGLSADRREEYSQDLQTLAQITAGGATTIGIQGRMPTGSGASLPFNATLPMDVMQASAQHVGSLIASSSLAALGGNNIQALETWDDPDEDTARLIAQNMIANISVAGQGDDAALLAGATIAAFDQPGLYDIITARLNEALDASFASDPYWGTPSADRAFIQTELMPENSPELERYLTAR
jgi:hypothetical protein